MVHTMEHGGKRDRTGRKPIHPQIRDWAVRAVKTEISRRALDRVRSHATSAKGKKYYVTKFVSSETESEESAAENVLDVIDYWKELPENKPNADNVPLFERGKIGAIIVDGNSVPKSSQFEMRDIFQLVANRSASAISNLTLSDREQYAGLPSLIPHGPDVFL